MVGRVMQESSGWMDGDGGAGVIGACGGAVAARANGVASRGKPGCLCLEFFFFLAAASPSQLLSIWCMSCPIQNVVSDDHERGNQAASCFILNNVPAPGHGADHLA